MHISRIQVEEGFLAGLDLKLSPGLNVLIGPRGSGKTSIIELIRFCLGASTFTDRAASLAHEHAKSVLGSGEVTVTLTHNGHEVTVTRSVGETRGRASGQVSIPTVLSQNEIEIIGLDPASRLRLLDAFRSEKHTIRAQAERLRLDVRALTVDARSIEEEISNIDESITALTIDTDQLQVLEKKQTTQLAQLKIAKTKQDDLTQTTNKLAALGVQVSLYERTLRAIGAWQQQIRQVVDRAPRLESWPDSAGTDIEDGLARVRAELNDVFRSLQGILGDTGRVIERLQLQHLTANKSKTEIESIARKLRSDLESYQQGSGVIARKISELREKAGQKAALCALRKDLVQKRAEILRQRDRLLDELDAVCQEEYDAREKVASWLNGRLQPRIHTEVTRYGLPTTYIEVIRAALRGSGLKYNAVAEAIAHNISPRELTIAVENRDPELIARTMGLSTDRAARLLAELARTGVEDIVTCDVQDTVTFSLLDGTDYKTTEHISTGQRCTVVLPILLQRPGGTLIIDQPEDHLDNAFVVDTAVAAIRSRNPETQLIFSTHNPNIPVLGGADLVILLGSDGRRGFVRHAGPLDDRKSVNAISTVMEGGLEAFRRRSEFYDRSAKTVK